MNSFTTFLPCDELPQGMHITRDAHGDIVFALPCVFPIVTAVDVPPAHPAAAYWIYGSALDPQRFQYAAPPLSGG